MRNVDRDKTERDHSEKSEGDKFASMLDGLLKVSRSELAEALEQEKKKIKKSRKVTKTRRP
ncbi:MAG: hypothetical protein P4L83_06680 [Nevskia sp.]|nr:hypothetical protein [Nevskia sp.]